MSHVVEVQADMVGQHSEVAASCLSRMEVI